MKKKLIILDLHLTVVALVLILTMVSLAWYTENDKADTSSAVITAEPLDDLDITDIVDNIDHYKGQTGLGGEDAPYIATKIIRVSQESTNADDAVTCNLENVRVVLANGKEVTTPPTGFSSIGKCFTFRVNVVTLGEGNTVEMVKGVFYPDEKGVLRQGEDALYYQDENYFSVSDSDSSSAKICTTHFQLEMIFLDENSYSNYITPNSNEKITPFAFSDYDYMGSKFYAVFVLGME